MSNSSQKYANGIAAIGKKCSKRANPIMFVDRNVLTRRNARHIETTLIGANSQNPASSGGILLKINPSSHSVLFCQQYLNFQSKPNPLLYTRDSTQNHRKAIP
jgi:hypothetical protein